MTATVITAMYGDHDYPPKAPVYQDIPTRWVYYTDSSEEADAPWETIRREPRFDSPNLSAKLYKLTPPLFGDVVWIDANMEITSPSFVREALASRHDGIAVWQHPRRHCIYDEADATMGAERQGDKYDGLDIAKQIASYRAEGYPPNAGLYACGTIAWDLENGLARSLGNEWMQECIRWSPQDQLSLPVACRRLGIMPGLFPYPQIARRPRRQPWPGYIENAWLRIHDHRGGDRERDRAVRAVPRRHRP